MEIVFFENINTLILNTIMGKHTIVIHGGAGTLIQGKMTPEKELAYRAALKQALDIGFELLENGGSAVDAVEKAVVSLENTPLFNAGKGSVFTNEGLKMTSISCKGIRPFF